MPLIALLVSTIFEELMWNVNLIIGAIMIIFGNILILKKSILSFKFFFLNA